MQKFICTFDSNGVLTSLRDPQDQQWKTNFLLSFGNMPGVDQAKIERIWTEDEAGLLLTIRLFNPGIYPLVFNRVKMQIDANVVYVQDQQVTYFERVMQHACICGNSSFIYWHRPSGEGRFLALLPLDNVIFTEERNETPYAVGLPSITLQPLEEKIMRFRLCWMNDHKDIGDLLVKHGGVAVSAFPGLVIPEYLKMLLKVKCEQPIHNVLCDGAEIVCLSKTDTIAIYQLIFQGYGERRICINYGEGKETSVLCYATKPLAHLMDSVAKHIVEKQRYVGEAWYNGVFSQWNIRERKMTTPDDPMELPVFATSCDDPGLNKAPYIAEKNVVRPDPKEIEAVEYYIKHFLWGGLQRTDEEDPYPWGIIGSDKWIDNRNSKFGYGTAQGQERMWRTFDYTHIVQLYYNMYRIAREYPQYVKEMDAPSYLNRAARTALAFFEVPYQIFMREPWYFRGYSDWAFKQGNFHELYILPVIDACEKEANEEAYRKYGLKEMADKLRCYWETKAKYMIYDNPLPFGSEMWFDSTAFESTQAVAHYAVEHGLTPDKEGWYDKNMYGPGRGGYRSHLVISPEKHREFMDRQIRANLCCRGTQMRDFSLQGSDFRTGIGGFKDYRLSYMSQMGGAAVLDYALYFDENPSVNLRIGYTSLLSSWCLVNLGEDDPFYPHADNEGASGWAFQSENWAKCWNMFDCKRGPWIYDSEIQNGFSGAVYAACSVLAHDQDFGLVCYGADWKEKDDELIIWPMDGVRRTFHDLHEMSKRRHLKINRDEIVQIILKPAQGIMRVQIDNTTGDVHTVEVTWQGKTQFIQMDESTQWLELPY